MAKVTIEKRSPLKDKPLRQAGQSAQEKVKDLLLDDFGNQAVLIGITGVMFMTSFIVFIFPAPKWMMLVITGLYFLGACIYAIPKMRAAIGKVKNYKLGRDGERIVSEYLESLRKEGAYVLHDVVGGSFNLDHVVISKYGVFVIETKTRSKRKGNPEVTFDGETLLIDGMKPISDPLRQARRNAEWLRNFLKQSTGKDFPVKSIVTFPGWWIPLDANARKGDIWVLPSQHIPKNITREPIELSDNRVIMANSHLEKFIRSS